mmetsp:Transcript_10145/g.8673  ORF Transcript_10145/g.8673 Transcript_10145/m.8673 type:complete len:271 (+) Transcript_10145:2353-3165(+)|eukprot:CAMPEP_0114578988 /NCGR_PEP_ID=MMETSP0125-20121206/3453_1 /TAXON_ID=485358 ORGANISM="Aristerostoma sp., Strain ATCC 50986" /NCGR_SAMPLE_ID=MMETSP0125 /ASSEMBLY_ACC=CAM_ASM_000245 /LENGTH=270 /DNA_ID=CAMNT_0001769459 /DNA_START=2330 /DNA_END=3142 /DNA_ORIENTATION=+
MADSQTDLDEAGFCIGESSGADLNADYGCADLPVRGSDKFFQFGFGIPTPLLLPLCPTIASQGGFGDLMTFCSVTSTCNGKPTVAMTMDADFLICMGENPAILKASGGFSSAFGAMGRLGLSRVSFGISAGGDFEYGFKIWDGDSIRRVFIAGNYFDSVEFSLDELRKQLRLPNWIELSGKQIRFVHIPTDFGFITDPKQLGTTVRNFAYGAELTGSFRLKFSDLTKGALPDSPLMELGSATMVFTTLKSDGNMPPTGFYLRMSSNTDTT